MLSHAVATCVGVYIGLLLNSKLHMDSLTFPAQEFYAPLSSFTNETDRYRVIANKQQTRQGAKALNDDAAAAAAFTNNNNASRSNDAVNNNNININNIKAHPICQRLHPVAPALDYWTRHASQIHAATQLTPYDTKFHFHDFTAQLLHIITPRLPHSILSVPHDWSTVQTILDKALARYEYLQNPASKPFAPPVKMVILGGSVLVGRNCRKLMKDLGIQDMLLPNRACTWAYRLQVFFDQVFIPDVVKITKISVGGTNTAIGATIFQYDLLPESARHPDIVLNAYSTNDMHILTILEAQSAGNQTLRDRVFEITQEFVRVVMEKRPCQTTQPLLLHIDDYLGNEQREIWATTELAQGVGVLAHYYGFATMSYANVVRQWVYGDTRETWFSPEGWYANNKKKGEMTREIHPGMGMHIVATWVVAYNLLNLVTTYCSLEPWLSPPKDSMDYSKSFLAESLPLMGYLSDIPGKPKLPPQSALPPLLTPELSLETISGDWREVDKQFHLENDSLDCSKRSATKCIFSWVSGMSQQQDNTTWIEEHFGARQVKSDGWKLVNDGGKLGYSPTKLGDETILEFPKLSQDISTVTFFTLKSYGKKWENSKLRAMIEVRSDGSEWKELAADELIGIHDKETSEMYTTAIELPSEAKGGTSLRVRYRLESGETFKLMGLAVCS